MVIFHGYVSHNQMVNHVSLEDPGSFTLWSSPRCVLGYRLPCPTVVQPVPSQPQRGVPDSTKATGSSFCCSSRCCLLCAWWMPTCGNCYWGNQRWMDDGFRVWKFGFNLGLKISKDVYCLRFFLCLKLGLHPRLPIQNWGANMGSTSNRGPLHTHTHKKKHCQ